jgi:hypothetical protein
LGASVPGVGNSKIKALKKFFEFGVNALRVFYKILVQAFNEGGRRIGNILYVFHPDIFIRF